MNYLLKHRVFWRCVSLWCFGIMLRNYSSYDIKLAVDLHTPSKGCGGDWSLGGFKMINHWLQAKSRDGDPLLLEFVQPRQCFNLPKMSQWPFGLSQLWFTRLWETWAPACRRWESGDHHHRIQLPSHVLDSTSASWRSAGSWVCHPVFECQKILLTKAIGPPQCHWMQHATRRPLGFWHYLWNWAEEPRGLVNPFVLRILEDPRP